MHALARCYASPSGPTLWDAFHRYRKERYVVGCLNSRRCGAPLPHVAVALCDECTPADRLKAYLQASCVPTSRRTPAAPPPARCVACRSRHAHGVGCVRSRASQVTMFREKVATDRASGVVFNDRRLRHCMRDAYLAASEGFPAFVAAARAAGWDVDKGLLGTAPWTVFANRNE